MFRSNALLTRTVALLVVGICLQAVLAPVSLAQDKCIYAYLQILVPGEEPDPDSPGDKIGVPLPQMVGVPFQVRVFACAGSGNTHPGVNHVIAYSCTDDEAELPTNTPMHEGVLESWVTLNTVGDFTISASDRTDWHHLNDTSSLIPIKPVATQPTHLEISQIEHSQTAGESLIVTIEARRINGHLNTNINGQVFLHQLTSFGQGVMAPEFVTLTDGQWTGIVTFYLASPTDPPGGSVRVKAVMQDPELQGLSNFFHVEPGHYDRLVLLTPGQNWTPWIVDGLNGNPVQQWADEPFQVSVVATDQYWNQVDVSDIVKLESGDYEANTPVFGPLQGGRRTFEVSMRTPGSWFLAVGDMEKPEIGGMVSQEVPVFYSHLQILLPGEEPAPGTETGKTGLPLAQVAGVPFPIKVRACNANFEPVPTDRVVARLSTTDHTASLPEALPLQNGELITQLTFNSTGNFTVSAEDITGPEYYNVTSPAVSVNTSSGVVASLEIQSIDTQQTAGQPVTITIKAVDTSGDQIYNFSGPIHLEQLTSLGRGSLVPEQINITDGAWTGPVTFHLADQSVLPGEDGAVRLQAASQLDGTVTGTSNYFQVGPGSLSRLLILVPGQYLVPATEGGLLGGPAAQTTGFPFQTEIYTADHYWNRVPVSHLIQIQSMDPNASTPVQASLADGHATVPVTFGSVGDWTLVASDLTDPSVAAMTTVPISVLNSSPDFVIEPVTGPVTAGDPVLVTIRTNSPEGHHLANYDGYAMLAANTGPETIQPVNIQFTNGEWTGEVTFFGATPQASFSCIDFATPPNIGSSTSFEVNPGAFAGLQVLLPGQENVSGRNPGYSGDPVEQEAGIPFLVTVQAVDSWWNPVEEGDAAISLDPTDPFALAPRDTNLTAGRLDIETTFLRAGEHTLAATCDTVDIADYTSGTFTVRPGPYTKIIALAPGEELLAGSELGKAGLALDQSISYSFTMRALATDNWWNPVVGIYDLIELVCTDPLADVPETFSLVDGQAEILVRLSTAGYQLMTLNNLGNPEVPPAHTQMRAIESGFHIRAEIHPEQVVAGHPFTLSVRVVNDAGAVMQDINGFADVVALNAVTQEPGQGELLDASFQFYQGVRSITQTYTKSEPIVLVVTSQLGDAPGMTGVLSVVPGEPASLNFHETATWVGGRHSTDINAKVADELDNGIPGVPVDFQLTGGTGTLEIIYDITDADGLAKARYTGASQPESGFIQVVSVGFTTGMEIMTSMMNPTGDPGTISNGPNPFHPGEGPTHIWYNLARDAQVTMRIFTLSGTLVLKEVFAAGSNGGTSATINEIDWDGKNGEGEYVASGGYILYVEAVSQGETIHQLRRRIAVVR